MGRGPSRPGIPEPQTRAAGSPPEGPHNPARAPAHLDSDSALGGRAGAGAGPRLSQLALWSWSMAAAGQQQRTQRPRPARAKEAAMSSRPAPRAGRQGRHAPS